MLDRWALVSTDMSVLRALFGLGKAKNQSVATQRGQRRAFSIE